MPDRYRNFNIFRLNMIHNLFNNMVFFPVHLESEIYMSSIFKNKKYVENEKYFYVKKKKNDCRFYRVYEFKSVFSVRSVQTCNK